MGRMMICQPVTLKKNTLNILKQCKYFTPKKLKRKKE